MRTMLWKAGTMAALIAATAGCSQLGPIGDVLGTVLTPAGQQGGGASQIQAQIRTVDTRSQAIQVTTSDGRTGSVYFDNRTRVVYQQREYPVTALEAGDVVVMRLQQDQGGRAYTDLIEVTRSVQESGSGGVYSNGNIMRMEGTVGQVDVQRGIFELRDRNGRSTLVTMPYNAGNNERYRFERLRSGDFIRLEGRYTTNDRFELYRFN